MTDRADIDDGDLFRRNTGLHGLPSHEGFRPIALCHGLHEAAQASLACHRVEQFEHRLIDLVATRPGRRARCSPEDRLPESQTSRPSIRSSWARCRPMPAPARMDRRDGLASPIVDEHRHTIGRSHDHGHSRLIGDQRIPSTFESIPFCHRSIDDRASVPCTCFTDNIQLRVRTSEAGTPVS